jgi:methylenetetrahydrofolate reductase (NADH)
MNVAAWSDGYDSRRVRELFKSRTSHVMSESFQVSLQHHAQFEVLPLGRAEGQAAEIGEPVSLTVTCSPRHGPDRSVEVAQRLAALGHAVTVHLAARMVCDRAHLDTLLAEMARAGVDDVFLIGGDTTPPHGPYSSAGDLLPLLCDHPRRPRQIGIAGYPEGHPLIDAERLTESLEQKSALASYITTQLCFDPGVVLAWVRRVRERRIMLPVLVGLPGVVDRRRLLEISMRIGVGPSLAFLRKQRRLRAVLAPSSVTPERVHEPLLPHLGDRELGILGFHYYTFDQLVDTWRWHRETRDRRPLTAEGGLRHG